jgi:hypothetical protein
MKEQSMGGINTNFYSAVSYIIESIRESGMKDEEIRNMTMVVLSDMQMDNDNDFDKSLLETIEEKYRGTIPSLCFWNLQTQTSQGIPCNPNLQQHKPLLVSGTNPKSIEIRETNPYASLETHLYSHL